MPPARRNNDWAPIMRALSLTGYLGFIMAGSILGGLAVGWCLDRAIGTKSIFKIIFIFVGVAGGFVNAYKTIIRTIR